MPDRLVRDELLDSDRYNSLSSDTARMLFVHLLLAADDLGNAEATAMFVRRRLLPHGGSDEVIAKLIGELADADLIRVYLVEGKRYAHIPRFRQRLRSYKRVNPRPPAEVECSEIKALMSNLSDKLPASDGQLPGRCQSLAGETKEEKEEKKYMAPSAPSAERKIHAEQDSTADPQFERAWKRYPERLGGNPKKAASKAWAARRREGVAAEAMLEGVERYAVHCRATGKAGTQYVMQAKTFFGPDRRFEDLFDAPASQERGFVC